MKKLLLPLFVTLFTQVLYGQINRCETIKKGIDFVLRNEAKIDTTVDFSRLLISKKRLYTTNTHFMIEIDNPSYWCQKKPSITEEEFASEVQKQKDFFGDSLCEFQTTTNNWTHSIWFSDIVFDVLVVVINDFSLDEANGYGPSGNFIEYAIEVQSHDSFSVIYRWSGSY
jgi:hypothetical protein